MKNKILIFLLFINSYCFGQVSVPNTETFSLQDVYNAVHDHTPATIGTLQSCFDNAISSYFNPTYNQNSYAPANSMLRFRDYKPTGYETIKFGYLYNRHAVTDSRNITSSGWHIPNRTEYETMTSYLGGNTTAGGKLKEAGTTYWQAPNTGADNSSKFNGRGSGYRLNDGSFTQKLSNSRIYAILTTPVPPTYNEFLILSYNLNSALVGSNNTYTGLSLRPLKDSTTLTDGQEGTYTGNDGKVYRTICIGTQEWVADNLAETKYRNGDLITVVTSNSSWAALTTEARCVYDNDENNR